MPKLERVFYVTSCRGWFVSPSNPRTRAAAEVHVDGAILYAVAPEWANAAERALAEAGVPLAGAVMTANTAKSSPIIAATGYCGSPGRSGNVPER